MTATKLRLSLEVTETGKKAGRSLLDAAQSLAAGWILPVASAFVAFGLGSWSALAAGEPLTIVRQPVSQSVVLGAEVGLEVVASGAGPFSYHWTFNGTPLGAGAGPLFLIPHAGLSNAGTYRVTVSNLLAGVASDDAVLTVVTGAVQEVWRTRLDGPLGRDDTPTALARDANGNVFVVGNVVATNGFTDIVVAKYSPAGERLWSRFFVGMAGGEDEVRAAAVDPAGNLYVGGYSFNAITLRDFALLKYAPDGTLIWVRRYDSLAHGNDEITSLALDASGDPVVAGSSDCPGEGLDYVTLKYDSAGALLWVTRYSGPSRLDDVPAAVAVDSLGNVLVTGASGVDPSAGDIATLKYSADGDFVWARRFEGSGINSRAQALAVSSDGSVHVGGSSYEPWSGTAIAVTLKYDPAGNLVWVARSREGEDPLSEVNALAVDATGNVYSAGRGYRYDKDWDFITMKHSPAGNLLWTARYGGYLGDFVRAMALDPSGNVVVAGTSRGSVTSNDFATVKYDPNGTLLWEARFNGLGVGDDAAETLMLAAPDSTYVAGTSADTDPGTDIRLVRYAEQPLVGAPRFTAVPQSQKVVEGTLIALSVAVTGNEPMSLQWHLNDLPVPDATNAVLTLPNIQGWEGGDYTLVASNSVAQVKSPEARIVVLTSPYIYGEPQSQAVFKGTEATFRVMSQGMMPLFYQWQRDSIDIPGATNPILTVPSVGVSALGTYTVKVSNLVGTATSSNAVLSLLSGPVGSVWSRDFDAGYYPDITRSMTVDTAGNVYVTGSSFDEYYLMGTVTLKYAPDGRLLWSARFSDAEPTAITVDPGGNVLVAGYRGFAFGLMDGADFLTLKYDPSGNLLWQRTYNGPGNLDDHAVALAVDTSGNVLVTGTSYGGDPSRNDYATIKYNAAGGELWVKRFNGVANGDDTAAGLAVDPAGSVLVTGTSAGAGTGTDFATIKYDSAGNPLWVSRFNGSGSFNDQTKAIALDLAGNVLVAGTSYGGVTPRNDFAVVKYTSGGTETWARRYNYATVNGDESLAALATDNQNNVYVTGSSPGAGSGLDYATVKYDASGVQRWVHRYDGPDALDDEAFDLTVDSNRNVYVTGSSFSYPTDKDILTLKISEAGAQMWSIAFNGLRDEIEVPVRVALGGGRIHVAGTTKGWVSSEDFVLMQYAEQPPFVNLPPQVLLLQPKDGATFAGPARIVLQAAASDPDGSVARVEFLQGNAVLGSVSNAPYTLQWTNVPAGSYLIVARAVDNQGAIRYSNPAKVSVLLPAVISTLPTNQLPIVDTSVLLRVDASGTGLRYQWRLNGVNIPHATGPELPINYFQSTDGGLYSVVVANAVSAETRTIAALSPDVPTLALSDAFGGGMTNDEFAAVYRASNTNATKEPGEPNHAGRPGSKSVWLTWQAPATGIVYFSTRGSGFDTLLAVYKGSSLAGLQFVEADDDRGGFLTSALVFPAQAGEVYQVAVDGFARASGPIVLSWYLDDLPAEIPRIVFEPESVTAAPGQNVMIKVTATSPTPLRYQWFFNCAPIPRATNATVIITNVTPNSAGGYTVVLRNASSEVVQSETAFLDIGGDSRVAAQDKFLNAVPTIQPRLAGSDGVGVRGTTGNGKDNAPATGYTGTQVFSTLDATTEPGEPNHCGVVGGASEWFVYQALTNGMLNINTDGSDFDTVLAVYTGPGTDFESLVSVDCNDDGGLDGADSSVTFSAIAGTLYYVAVDGVGGARGTVELNYLLSVMPSISTQPVSQTVAAGSNATVTVTLTGTPPMNYTWYFNGMVIGGATNFCLVLTNFQSIHEGFYSVAVSNVTGVVTSAVAAVYLNAPMRMGSYGVLTNGAFRLQLLGTAGSNYVVQASSSLTNWVSVWTNVPPNGIIEFIDPGATNLSHRFYRAVRSP